MNSRLAVFTVLAAMAASVSGADDSATANHRPLRGLLVTGGCCHDYPRQTEIITEGMNERIGPVKWTVVNYGTERTGELSVYADPDWADEFDVVVHNECYGGVTDPAIVARIVGGHVKSGVPAVAIHCSMHSYRGAENADLWRALIGVTSTRHERGKRRLSVVPADADHPIMADFPSEWKTPNGELYIIERTWPGMHVLATAHSKETDRDEPVVWTNQYQGVRMFATTLGHHNETMESPEWLDLVARGVQWAMEKP